MKRLFVVIFILSLTGTLLSGEESNPQASFGMQLDVDYNCISDSLNIWNLRAGLGIDFMFNLGSVFYIGVEAGALFGFHKKNLADSDFDRIYIEFPLRCTVTLLLGGFNIQAYGGLVYTGGADLSGGIVYAQDFSFTPYPEVGGRIGFGKTTYFFLDGGYVIGDQGYFYLGIGMRLGLF
jgi:hypothetical protein